MLKNNDFTLTAVNREIVMMFQALIARQTTYTRFALTLSSLAVASQRRYGTNLVALTVPTAGFNVAITVLKNKR